MVKNLTPIQTQGVIVAPPSTLYFRKMQFKGVFCPFLQSSLS